MVGVNVNFGAQERGQRKAVAEHRDIEIHVNTVQLDSSTIKDLINTIMPQDDVDESCSGTKGPDEEADSDSAQVTFPAESNLADSRPTH